MGYPRQLTREARLCIRQELIYLNALLDDDPLYLAEDVPAYRDNVGHIRLNSAAVLRYPTAVLSELTRIAHGRLDQQEMYLAVRDAGRYLRCALARGW